MLTPIFSTYVHTQAHTYTYGILVKSVYGNVEVIILKQNYLGGKVCLKNHYNDTVLRTQP